MKESQVKITTVFEFPDYTKEDGWVEYCAHVRDKMPPVYKSKDTEEEIDV
jgi:hypothetical protein